MSNNHRRLHDKILEALQEDLIHMLPALSDAQASQLLKKLFKNYRVNKQRSHSTGLRLSTLGNQLMHKHYRAYDYKYQGKRNHSVLIALDKNMQWPYYIGSTVITFYSEQDAAWFGLNGNNIENFVNYI